MYPLIPSHFGLDAFRPSPLATFCTPTAQQTLPHHPNFVPICCLTVLCSRNPLFFSHGCPATFRQSGISSPIENNSKSANPKFSVFGWIGLSTKNLIRPRHCRPLAPLRCKRDDFQVDPFVCSCGATRPGQPVVTTPPSITRTCPVIIRLAEDAKNRHPFTMSLGFRCSFRHCRPKCSSNAAGVAQSSI